MQLDYVEATLSGHDVPVEDHVTTGNKKIVKYSK